LTILLIVMAVWWVILLTQEAQARTEAQLQKLAADRLHAIFLLQTSPEIAADPAGRLGSSFPHLRYRQTPDGVDVTIAPEVRDKIHNDARRRRNMMIWEGIFFLALIAAGSSVLLLAHRREQALERTRELFLAGVTHEFKTPLASLRLYAETLARSDLDDAARVGIRSRLVELAGYIADHRTQVRSDLPAGHFVLGQELTLNLALRNLIHNAVRHGGESPRVTITLRRDGTWHRLTVSDDGPGIPRRLHTKVFECFYSGSSSTGGDQSAGTGLGLYLVKRNVETLGGRIELESAEQQGATFTVSLPVYAGEEI
jgi:signal transduction histidine kinase